MDGLGFMIWQLSNMPAADDLAALLASLGVRWVSIKVLDGPNLYNANLRPNGRQAMGGGNQKLLKAYWAAIEAKGIEVGGWQYVYGDQPGAEGDAALAFHEEFKPKHFLIDAEGEYKRYGATRAAKTYCSKLHNGRRPGSALAETGQVEVLLCSYRFPSLHRGLIKPFPLAAFCNHEKVDGVAPQMYWIGAHDVVDQLQRSYDEYRDITFKPFIPIGSAFATGRRSDSARAEADYWEPTTTDFYNFTNACRVRGFKAYGFYSLDFILKNNRKDWLGAICGVPAPPPPLPGDTRVIAVASASIRNKPLEIDETLFGRGILDATVKVTGDAVNGYVPVEAWIYENALEKD